MDWTVWQDLRAVLRPERPWHYLLHAYVVLVCSAYWISALWAGGDASLAELILFRPAGDIQIYPVIRAMSEGNFGEPTDSLRHAQGIMSYPPVVLLPHALLRALFGDAGYIVADAVLPCFHFVALTMVLRQCRLGGFASLLLAALITSGAVAIASVPAANCFDRVATHFGWRVWEPDLPNLIHLELYTLRIQRPLITEIYVMLTLYLMLKTLREERMPGGARGLALGAVMTLMFQGDMYSTATLGLVLLVILGWLCWRARKLPSQSFVGAAVVGALLTGWFTVVQRVLEHPDVAARLGLIDYPRWPLLFLPGHGWLIRIAVVLLLGAGVWLLARRRGAIGLHGVVGFWSVVVVLAGLTQPIQIALVGKQVQIYHYGHNLKVFYCYAVVILLYHTLALGVQWAQQRWRLTAPAGTWVRRGALAIVLLAGAILGSAEPRGRHEYQRHPGGASVSTQPWAAFETAYRPALRELEQRFHQDEALRSAQTFATSNQDVYLLLTAFFGKRAFMPDAALSMIENREIEKRLLVMGLILGLDDSRFQQWVGDYHILLSFFGGNKYRFATDYRFASDLEDYPVNIQARLTNGLTPPQDGWSLFLPISERMRMVSRFQEIRPHVAPTDPSLPEVIVLCPSPIESVVDPSPHPAVYRTVFTNSVFEVFLRRRL